MKQVTVLTLLFHCTQLVAGIVSLDYSYLYFGERFVRAGKLRDDTTYKVKREQLREEYTVKAIL